MQTTIRLPIDVLTKFRKMLVDRRCSMAEMIERLIREWIEKHGSESNPMPPESAVLRPKNQPEPQAVKTERSVAKMSLQHAFLRWVPAVTLIKDLSSRILYANKAYQKLTDCSLHTVLGQLPSHYFPEPVADAIMAHDRVVRDNGVAILSIERFHIGDRMTIRFPIVENKRIVIIGALGFDLKSIKGAVDWPPYSEYAAPEPVPWSGEDESMDRDFIPVSEELLQGFFRCLPAIAVWKDLQGRMIHTNAEYERVTSKSRDQACGNFPTQNWPREVGESIMAEDASVRQGRRPLMTVDKIPVAGGVRERLNIRFPIFADGQLDMTASLGLNLALVQAGAELLNQTPQGGQRYLRLSDIEELGPSAQTSAE